MENLKLLKQQIMNDVNHKNISTHSGDNYRYENGTILIHNSGLEWVADDVDYEGFNREKIESKTLYIDWSEFN